METNIETEKVFEVVTESLLHLIVCTNETNHSAIESWLKKHRPAGTRAGWMCAIERENFCVQCAEHNDRKHYLMVC